MVNKNKQTWLDIVNEFQEKKGMDDRALAKAMGRFPSHIKHLKYVTEIPGTVTLHRLGKALGVPPERWGRSRVQTIMIKKGVSVADIQRETGWSEGKVLTNIYRIEQGDGNVFKKNILKLCEVLKTRPGKDLTNLYDKEYHIYIVPKDESPEDRQARLEGNRVWGKMKGAAVIPDEIKEVMKEREFYGSRMSRDKLLKLQEERLSTHARRQAPMRGRAATFVPDSLPRTAWTTTSAPCFPVPTTGQRRPSQC